MQQISQHYIWNNIKELLYQHDCVIVPNFGGFVCNKEHARIDQVSHVITPESKRVMFNQNLKSNDGLLAQQIANRLNISYNEALKQMDDLVNQLRGYLEETKQLDINTFGSFRLNADANYVFLPDKYNNYLHSSFGLMPLQATTVVDMVKRSNKRTGLFKDRKEIKEAKNLSKSRSLGFKFITVSVVLLMVVNTYIFWGDSMLFKQSGLSTTGINSWFDSLMSNDTQATIPVIQAPEIQTPKTEKSVDIHTPQAKNLDYNNELTTLNIAEAFSYSAKEAPVYGSNTFAEDGSLILPLNVTEETPNNSDNITSIDVESTVIQPSASATVGINHYYVIGGVFCKEKNARKYFDKLKEKGFDAHLILNKRLNCNRVGYKRFDNLADAIALMDSIKATENPEAWVLTIKE